MSNLLLLFFFLSLLVSSTNLNAKNTDSINAIIGDESFFITFHRSPNQFDSEELRIKTHLRFVLTKLQHANISELTDNQLENRHELLSQLKIYINAGVFPSNEYSTQSRRPNFIDSNGNICAVGYLVEQTTGRETAELLNELYQFEYVMDMNSQILEDWLYENGITKLEAAMIQPAYHPFPEPDESHSTNSISTNYAISSGLLLVSQATLTGFSFSDQNNLNTRFLMSLTATGLGVISFGSGYTNYKESKTTYSTLNGSVDVRNNSRANFSILNMVFGTTSIILNGYRALQFKKQRKSESIVLKTDMLFIPISKEPIPSLSLNYSF